MKLDREKLKKDLLLIRESIMFKWKPILHKGKEELGPKDCSLCCEYSGCSDGCPIWKSTKQIGCMATPFYDWCDFDSNFVDSRESAQVAVNMINFLLRLERDLQKKLNRRVGKLKLEKLPAKWRTK